MARESSSDHTFDSSASSFDSSARSFPFVPSRLVMVFEGLRRSFFALAGGDVPRVGLPAGYNPRERIGLSDPNMNGGLHKSSINGRGW